MSWTVGRGTEGGGEGGGATTVDAEDEAGDLENHLSAPTLFLFLRANLVGVGRIGEAGSCSLEIPVERSLVADDALLESRGCCFGCPSSSVRPRESSVKTEASEELFLIVNDPVSARALTFEFAGSGDGRGERRPPSPMEEWVCTRSVFSLCLA